MKYFVRIRESRQCDYIVEADDEDEAVRKAAQNDVDPYDNKCLDVFVEDFMCLDKEEEERFCFPEGRETPAGGVGLW